MPLQRNQPSPERQSVLSFVSPSVADLLFFETVDAKTVGAGSSTTITNTSKATQDLAVASGYHGPDHDGSGSVVGELLTLTAASHSLAVDDVVVVEDLGFTGISPNGSYKVVNVPDANSFKIFVRSVKSGGGYAGVGTLSTTSTSRVYKSHPSYGTAHPDTENFPKHKLCHVKQADGEGLFFQYYYAAEREFQDDYNFEFSQSDLGGNQYDTVVRTYVIPRSDFTDTDTEYQAGDAMPDVPAAQFTDSYILMTRQQKRIGDQELDGLFVVEQRVYFKDEDKFSFNTHPEFKEELKTTEILAYVGKEEVPVKNGTVTWDTVQANAATNWGIDITNSYNYEVQKVSNDWWKIIKQQIVGSNRLPPASGGSKMLDRRPYAVAKEEIHAHVTPVVGDVLFYVTVDRPANASDGTPAHPAYGTVYGTAPFAAHKLCFVKQTDPEGLFFNYYYAADRTNQDNYNFEFSQADLGGNKYDTVVRTYVILRSDFDDIDADYKAGVVMDGDIDPTNQFTAENAVIYNRDVVTYGGVDEDDTSVDYILMTRSLKRIGEQELDSLFVVEQRVYFRRVDIVTQSYDPATEGVLKTVVKLIYRGESFVTADDGSSIAGSEDWEADVNWGLTAAGQTIESQQLSHDWGQVTIQDVIPQGLTAHAGTDSRIVRSYFTYNNFTWPSVLEDLFFKPVGMKNGTTKTVVTVRHKDGKEGFTGPTKMQILQYWRNTPFPNATNGLTHADVVVDPAIYPFKTSSANYAGVQFNVSANNVLCEKQVATDFIGTSHPVYKMGEYGFPKPWLRASTPTDWPSSAFVASASQKPFRGGYLLEVVKVTPPST